MQRLSQGHIVAICDYGDTDRAVVEIDPRAVREVAKLQLSFPIRLLETFADGRLLIASPRSPTEDAIQELDRRGRMLRVASVEPTSCAIALRNGNLLVGIYKPRGSQKRVLEVDRMGRVVWEVLTKGEPTGIYRCLSLVRLGFDRSGSVGIDLDSVASKISALKNPDLAVRRRAAEDLEAYGVKSEPAVPALIEALAENDEQLRGYAKRALAQIGRPALHKFINALQNGRPEVRAAAAHCLAEEEFLTESKVLARLLVEALKNESADVRTQAGFTLAFMPQEAKRFLPSLIAASLLLQLVLRQQQPSQHLSTF